MAVPLYKKRRRIMRKKVSSCENYVHKSHISRRMKNDLVGYAFILPALVFFMTFVIIPIATGVVTSFFHYTDKKFEFIGFGNYVKLFQDEIFLKSLKNTVILVVGVVPIIVIFSLFVSVVIYQKNAHIRSLMRGIFYLPVVTGTVAVTVVWKWIFDPISGVLNYVLMNMGVIEKEIMWLGDKRFVIWAIILVLFTTSVGQPIILYIAALGNLDKTHIEAAEIDGANSWQVFRYVKWPGIMPTTLYVVVITTINSFQCFSLVQLLTSGGPNYNTSTIMYLVYETAFKQYKFGYANAMGIILAIVICLFSLIQFKCFGKEQS